MEGGVGRMTQAMMDLALMQEKHAKIVSDGAMGSGFGITEEDMDMDFYITEEDMTLYAAMGSSVDIAKRLGRLTIADKPAGAGGKRKTLVRLDKEYIEMKMRLPPPTPYPRMPDDLIDRLEQHKCPPGRIRAQGDELTAYGQKFIDRDAKMRRQYALPGYADIEFTDDEEDYGEDWRSWAELKELGLVDG